MNKAKIILFDIDGVLIRLPHYFSEELEKQGYKNAETSMTSFHRGEDNARCLEGGADSRNMILPYLKKFSWNGSAVDYLSKQYDYESKYLDKDLVFMVKKLRNQGIKCCLCTDQDKNRAEYILNDMDFKNIFDKGYVSCYIGFRKCHENFWNFVIKDLKKEFPELNPGEILYFDDIQNNIEVALKFGIRAFLYKDIDRFKKDIGLV